MAEKRPRTSTSRSSSETPTWSGPSLRFTIVTVSSIVRPGTVASCPTTGETPRSASASWPLAGATATNGSAAMSSERASDHDARVRRMPSL
jgi:hypothetical protein